MKNYCLGVLLCCTISIANAQYWSPTFTSGKISIDGSAPSTPAGMDIEVNRSSSDVGAKFFNSNSSGRSLFLFGTSWGGNYGYLSYHGSSYSAGSGLSQIYKPSSTVLNGSGAGGLALTSSQDIRFTSGGDDDGKLRMMINSTGNIGIGTSSPTASLDVRGHLSVINTSPTNTYTFLGQNTTSDASTNSYFYHRITSNYHIIGSNGASGAIRKLGFAVGGADNDSDVKMTIDQSGNVGIGTSNPLAKLFVAGSIYSGATRTNTVFDGNINTQSANFIGSEGYWAFRSSVNNAFNLDVWNSETHHIIALTALQNGNVGIGTTNPTQKLTVKGTVYSTEVKVDINAGADYVFEKDYNLLSLDSIKTYIDQHKHLPEVPSAKEMEANGVNLGEMNVLLLKKIEELTLYLLQQQKQIDTQNEKILELQLR